MKEMGRSIIESLAGSIDRLSVNVTDAQVCGAKAKIRVAVVANSDATKTDILHAINAQFHGKLRAVARSFKIVETANEDRTNVQRVLEGYVVPNVEIVAMASDEGKVMQCVASNMFMDSQDCIWTKTGDFLYKKSDVETSEELNKFLTAVASSNVRMKKLNPFERISAVAGDFISYMSSGEMCYGFVVASDEQHNKLMVLAEGEEDPEVIDTFDVQSQVPLDDTQVAFPEEDEFVETSASSVDINAVISYYKRWFTYNPRYAGLLIERLKGHAFC